ncbi:MAG: sulfotransferase [Candidatus Zixiibacteriota bacterium]
MTAVHHPVAAGSAEITRLRRAAYALYKSGNMAGAATAFAHINSLAPDDAEALHMLGVLALKVGRQQEAIEKFTRALEIKPEFPDALNNLATILFGMGQMEAAERLFLSSLKYRPGSADTMCNLGGVLIAQKRYGEAEALLRASTALHPDYAPAFSNLSGVLGEMGALEDAQAAGRRAMELDPRNPQYMIQTGRLLMQVGRHDEARELFNRALSHDPTAVRALVGLVRSKKIVSTDPEVELFRQIAPKVLGLGADDRRDFLFAWGKLYDDIGDAEHAFQCWSGANRIRREQLPYSIDAEAAIFEGLMAAFSPEMFQRLDGSGVASELPVFIVGMPRSGTTLVEQILSSHPQVYGADELPFVAEQLATLSKRLGGGDLLSVRTELAQDDLLGMGQGYLDKIRALAPDASRITDKMPNNFRYVGFIKLMLPGARVIHVRRNPVDTCLSCFQQNFTHAQQFSNDLHDLGRYYGLYRRMMEHWRQVLPGYMLEVDYEDLVADPEGNARRMIDFIGLEWDDACLRHDENARQVRTASQWQVRQKVHTGSVERWRRYERQLQPLLEALRESGVEI